MMKLSAILFRFMLPLVGSGQTLITYADTPNHVSISLPLNDEVWHTTGRDGQNYVLFDSRANSKRKRARRYRINCTIKLLRAEGYVSATKRQKMFDRDFESCCDSPYLNNMNGAIGRGTSADSIYVYVVYSYETEFGHNPKNSIKQKGITFRYIRGNDAFFLDCYARDNAYRKCKDLFFRIADSVKFD